MDFDFKCDLTDFIGVTSIHIRNRVKKVKDYLENLGCRFETNADEIMTAICNGVSSKGEGEVCFIYSDVGVISTHTGYADALSPIFAKDKNPLITFDQLEYACLIFRHNYKDATHYIKRGTYIIPLMLIMQEKQAHWHYFENDRWHRFDFRDDAGMKNIFGKKFNWSSINKYKANDVIKWNKGLGGIKSTDVSPNAKPTTVFSELW